MSGFGRIIHTLPDPSGFSPDSLTDMQWSAARRLIEQALDAERGTKNRAV